jgi:DNA helicase-2/ATP-dependent DNA helicase PcrA
MLNPEQKKAVQYHKGPLLIVAGAGTGKTTVIVEKIKYLIKKKLALPEEILALTFTEKAASEMVDRVDREMPYGYFQMWISTFHSFADQILKEEASHIGVSPGYRLMSEAETVIFLKTNLFLFDLKYFRPLGNPNKFLESLLQHFSRLRDENIDPVDYLTWAKKSKSEDPAEKEKSVELAQAYKTYQSLKVKENLFDYGDLIYYLVKLFKTRKNILRKYQSKFKYVLIDEFQDTNIAQYDLLKLLCPPKSKPKLTIVGDDSQAIYKFRGASVSNILNFMKDFKKAKQVTLMKNYRSNQIILDAAYRLIKNNDPDTLEARLGISKKLIAQKKMSEKNPIKLFYSETSEEEAEYVAQEIIKLKKDHQFSDIAVLTRANSHSQPFINAFIRLGIPFQFLGPSTLYKQPEVKDLIAYIKVLNNPEDSVSLYRVLNMNIFDIDIQDLTLMMSFAKRTNLSLFPAIQVYLGLINTDMYLEEYENYKKFMPLLSKDSRGKILAVFNMFKKHLARVKKDTAGQILFYFLEDSTLLLKLTNYKTEKDEQIALNISKFFNKLKAFESDHEDASVSAVVEFIDMSMELGESPVAQKTDIGQYNAVNIITAHSAKGLEFKVVFLVNLTRGRFPTVARRETIPIPTALIKEILPSGDYHIQEERRLFYVGVTRAKERVYMTASRFYGQGKRVQKISPFVSESIGETTVEKAIVIKREEKQQLSIFDFRKPKEPVIKEKYFQNNFSYTQLETYVRCPLQYKYHYILKIPTPPTAAITFGNSIHKALQVFYQEFTEDKSVGLKRLLRIYEKNWLPVGYASPSHESRMKNEGEKILTGYFEKYHDKNLNIIGIEKPFKIKVTSDIYIVGKIDRVDGLTGKNVEIVDYKTGKIPDEKELKKSLQLSIYAMAATDRGLYKRKLSEVNLTFYYLQEPTKISFQKKPEDLMITKEKIIDIVGNIRTNDFTPTPGPWCDFCPFKMICEAWQ